MVKRGRRRHNSCPTLSSLPGTENYETIAYRSGDKFRGNIVAGKRHGKGVYLWTNGDKYTGSWSFGLMEGEGYFLWATGDEYVGEWHKGLFHGRGCKTMSDGSVVEGQFVRGKVHGWGKKTYACGDCYTGSYNMDKRHGYGTYQWGAGGISLVDPQQKSPGHENVSHVSIEGVNPLPSRIGKGQLGGVCHKDLRDQYAGMWVDDKIQGRGYRVYTAHASNNTFTTHVPELLNDSGGKGSSDRGRRSGGKSRASSVCVAEDVPVTVTNMSSTPRYKKDPSGYGFSLPSVVLSCRMLHPEYCIVWSYSGGLVNGVPHGVGLAVYEYTTSSPEGVSLLQKSGVIGWYKGVWKNGMWDGDGCWESSSIAASEQEGDCTDMNQTNPMPSAPNRILTTTRYSGAFQRGSKEGYGVEVYSYTTQQEKDQSAGDATASNEAHQCISTIPTIPGGGQLDPYLAGPPLLSDNEVVHEVAPLVREVQYSGEWKSDEKQGYGSQVDSTDGVYEGYFQAGIREGKGMYVRPLFDPNANINSSVWVANDTSAAVGQDVSVTAFTATASGKHEESCSNNKMMLGTDALQLCELCQLLSPMGEVAESLVSTEVSTEMAQPTAPISVTEATANAPMDIDNDTTIVFDMYEVLRGRWRQGVLVQ